MSSNMDITEQGKLAVAMARSILLRAPKAKRRNNAALPLPGDITEVTDVTPSMFVAIFESLFEVRIANIIRHPDTLAEHAHNAQIVIDALSSEVLDMDLSYIRGEDIALFKIQSVLNLLEILTELTKIVEKQGKVIAKHKPKQPKQEDSQLLEKRSSVSTDDSVSTDVDISRDARSRTQPAHWRHEETFTPGQVHSVHSEKRRQTQPSKSQPASSKGKRSRAGRSQAAQQGSDDDESVLDWLISSAHAEAQGDKDATEYAAGTSRELRRLKEDFESWLDKRKTVSETVSPKKRKRMLGLSVDRLIHDNPRILDSHRSLTQVDAIKLSNSLQQQMVVYESLLKERGIHRHLHAKREHDRKVRSARDSERAHKVFQVKARRLAWDLQREHRAREIRRVTEEERVYRDLFIKTTKMQMDRLREERLLDEEHRRDVAKERELRMVNIKNHYDRQLGLLREQLVEERRQRHIANHAQKLAVQQLEAEQKENLKEQVDLLREKLRMEEEVYYVRAARSNLRERLVPLAVDSVRHGRSGGSTTAKTRQAASRRRGKGKGRRPISAF